MSDTREILRRGLGSYDPPTDGYERVLVRRDRRRRNQRLIAGALAAAIMIAGALAFVRVVRTAPTPAEPVPAPSRGWVVYSAVHVEPGEGGGPTRGTDPAALYAQLPGQGPRLLAGGKDLRLTCPSFSADGTKLAYGEWNMTGDVTTIVVGTFADGRLTEPQRSLSGGGMQPCAEWSIDGWLAALDETGSLHVVDPDGAITVIPGVAGASSTRSVWSDAPSHLIFEWSPDGTRIAVANDREVLVVPRSGGDPEVVIPGAKATSVAWSPNGSTLLVAGNSGPGSNCCGQHVPHLWSISMDAPDDPVTEVPVNGRDGMGIFQVLWSPRSEVAVAVAIGAPHGFRVMLVDPRAGTQDITAKLPWVRSSVRLSPDGTRLLFVGAEPGSPLGSDFVMAVPLEGGRPVQYARMTTEGSGTDPGELAWQPGS